MKELEKIKKVRCPKGFIGTLIVIEFNLPMMAGDVVDLEDWVSKKFAIDKKQAGLRVQGSAELLKLLQRGKLEVASSSASVVHKGLENILKSPNHPDDPHKNLNLPFVGKAVSGRLTNQKIEKKGKPLEGKKTPAPGTAMDYMAKTDEIASLEHLKENKESVKVYAEKALKKMKMDQISSVIRKYGSVPFQGKYDDKTRKAKVTKADRINQLLKLQAEFNNG